MVLEETLGCVDSLCKLKGNKKIIIVDNHSINESGKQLKEMYADTDNIDVIINQDNVGFAVGNNIGCDFAKSMYNPDYYVVMNNDVEIIQEDFIERIEYIWTREEFDVLSPDIFSTNVNLHQSPKSLKRMTLERARKLQKQYKRKCESRIIVPLRCYIKQIKVLKMLYSKKKNNDLGIDYTKVYYNVPLHGSCFIFSKHFVLSRENVFFADTFFYFESEILDYECWKYGFKAMYDPSIKVFHHQNVSTNVTYTNLLKRTRFMNEQNYKSISAFLNTYDEKTNKINSYRLR